MTEIEHRVGVAKRLAAKIRGYLGDLTPEQWELPSACAEWQVRDVVSHMIGGAERQAETRKSEGLRSMPTKTWCLHTCIYNYTEETELGSS